MPSPATNEMPDKFSQLRAICTDTSVPVLNKPPNMTCTAKGGEIIPVNCGKDKANFFIPRVISFFKLAVKLKGAQDGRSLGRKGQATLKNLQINSAIAELATVGGGCGESTSRALIKLLKLKMNNGTALNIHQVTMWSNRFFGLTRRKDHIYLLLDSDISDISIRNSQEDVRIFFNNITQGWICDPWNNGHFSAFATNCNGYYSATEGGWSSLTVERVALDFEGRTSLTPRRQDHFESSLKELGLGIIPNDHLAIAQPLNGTGAEEIQKKQSCHLDSKPLPVETWSDIGNSLLGGVVSGGLWAVAQRGVKKACSYAPSEWQNTLEIGINGTIRIAMGDYQTAFVAYSVEQVTLYAGERLGLSPASAQTVAQCAVAATTVAANPIKAGSYLSCAARFVGGWGGSYIVNKVIDGVAGACFKQAKTATRYAV